MVPKGHSFNQVPLMNWRIDQCEAVTATVGGRRFSSGSVTLDLTDLVIEDGAIFGRAHGSDLKGPTSRPGLAPHFRFSMFPLTAAERYREPNCGPQDWKETSRWHRRDYRN